MVNSREMSESSIESRGVAPTDTENSIDIEDGVQEDSKEELLNFFQGEETVHYIDVIAIIQELSV